MTGWTQGFVAAACLLLASGAPAAPRHAGFTGDLGAGLALTWRRGGYAAPCFDCGSSSTTRQEIGIAPLSLSLGGFVTRDVAVLGRVAGTSYFDGDRLWLHQFFGPVVEWWPIDRLFLSAGAGPALYGKSPLESGRSRMKGGWALDGRLGVAMAQARDNDLTLSIEPILGFYERSSPLLGIAFVCAWKWY